MKYTNLYFLESVWVLLICTLLLFSSCGPSHHFAYAPSGINAPFLKQKNQLSLSGNIALGENDNGIINGSSNYGLHARTAYAVTDHFGVSAAYAASAEKDKYNRRTEVKSISYKRATGEISAGYFTPVSSKPNLYFELYGGYGLGGNSIKEKYKEPGYLNLSGGDYKNDYNQFFIQPAIVVHNKKSLQAGVFLRTSLVKFTSIRTDYSTDVLKNNRVRLYDLDKSPFIFFQPAASLRLPLSKSGNIHFNMEVNGLLKISGPDIYRRDAVFLFGITFSPSIKNNKYVHFPRNTLN